MKIARLALCVSSIAFLAGCTSYYRIADPDSGKTYYTTKIDRERGGAVRIDDKATGDHVTLQNSQISKISKEEYEAKTGAKK
jgi:hypothetical protein